MNEPGFNPYRWDHWAMLPLGLQMAYGLAWMQFLAGISRR
jgi:hypothetical protein